MNVLCRLRGHYWLTGPWVRGIDTSAYRYCERCGAIQQVTEAEIEQWKRNEDGDWND